MSDQKPDKIKSSLAVAPKGTTITKTAKSVQGTGKPLNWKNPMQA